MDMITIATVAVLLLNVSALALKRKREAKRGENQN